MEKYRIVILITAIESETRTMPPRARDEGGVATIWGHIHRSTEPFLEICKIYRASYIAFMTSLMPEHFARPAEYVPLPP